MVRLELKVQVATEDAVGPWDLIEANRALATSEPAQKRTNQIEDLKASIAPNVIGWIFAAFRARLCPLPIEIWRQAWK